MNWGYYKIIHDLFGIKICKVDVDPEDWITLETLTDDELKQRIKEYKNQGYEVEVYYQDYKRGKLQFILDYKVK